MEMRFCRDKRWLPSQVLPTSCCCVFSRFQGIDFMSLVHARTHFSTQYLNEFLLPSQLNLLDDGFIHFAASESKVMPLPCSSFLFSFFHCLLNFRFVCNNHANRSLSMRMSITCVNLSIVSANLAWVKIFSAFTWDLCIIYAFRNSLRPNENFGFSMLDASTPYRQYTFHFEELKKNLLTYEWFCIELNLNVIYVVFGVLVCRKFPWECFQHWDLENQWIGFDAKESNERQRERREKIQSS